MQINETLVLENGKLITPIRVMENGVLVIKERKIAEVGSRGKVNVPLKARKIDLEGGYISPGFIDLHVHGGGGKDAIEGEEALKKISTVHARGGTTSMLPAILTAPLEKMIQAIHDIARLREKVWEGASILGAHVEGPYFSVEQRGAQNPEYIIKPKPENYQKFLDLAEHIKIMSLAPEIEGALDLAKKLVDKGVVVSIAHTDATYNDVLLAIEAGFSNVTHIFSGMSGLKRIKAFRVAGVIESALLLDELTVEMIADGKHLPPSLMRLIVKCKGVDRICLVTDATNPAGMPPGEYVVGGLKVIVEDGVAKLPDRTAFAGSVATMNLLVKNMVKWVGVPLPQAVKMATLNPAKVIKVAHRKGTLTPGKDADLTIFDEDFDVKMTTVKGRVVFSK